MSLKIVDSETWYMMQARLFNETYAFRHVLSVLYEDGAKAVELIDESQQSFGGEITSNAMRDTPTVFGKLRSKPADKVWPELCEMELWAMAQQMFVFREQCAADVAKYSGPKGGRIDRDANS